MAAIPPIPWRISHRTTLITGMTVGWWLGLCWAAFSDRLVMR